MSTANYILNKISNSKKIIIILILFILIAFSIRLFHMEFRQVIGTDSYSYATCGRNLVGAEGFINTDGTPHLTNPPLTSLFIGLFWLVFKDLELAGRMMSVIFGSLLIIPVYLLAKNLWNKKIAILAAFLVAFYPGLVNISTRVLSESLYTFLLVSMVFIFWLALNKEKKDWLYFGLLGIMLGLCYLTRAIGFVYLSVIILWNFVYFLLKKKTFLQLITRVTICLIVFLVVSSPYLFFIYKHTGQFSLAPVAAPWLSINTAESELDLEIAKTSISRTPKVKIQKRYRLLDYVKKDPKLLVIHLSKSIFLFYKRRLADEIPPLIIIFIGLGLFGFPFYKEKLIKDSFLLSLSFPLFIQAFWRPDSRYIIPLTPFVLILTSTGLYTFKDVFLNSPKINSLRKKIIFILVIAIIIISFLPSIFKIVIQRSEQPIEHKKAGLWLKQFDKTNPFVMSRKPWVSFYADGAWFCLPYGTYEEIIDYAYKKKVKYLVIDERLITKFRPQLIFLLDENNTPSNLKLIYKDKSSGKLILIYQLKEKK